MILKQKMDGKIIKELSQVIVDWQELSLIEVMFNTCEFMFFCTFKFPTNKIFLPQTERLVQNDLVESQ